MTFSFGRNFRIRVFGESHGSVIGVIVEGCPPGTPIDEGVIQNDLDRRRPGQSGLVTPRKEEDKLQILSGVLKGKATGAPICMVIKNEDVDSSTYSDVDHIPRPGHADYTASVKYGGLNDFRGGGTFSGRMTATFVMAGAIAKNILKMRGIEIMAHLTQIGNVKAKGNVSDVEIRETSEDKIKCGDKYAAKRMEEEILKAGNEKDSIGSCIECRVLGVPPGVGEPMFDSIESVISHAMFSIPAVKGVSFGAGFACISMKGSQCNDEFEFLNKRIITKTNNSGGILGGISNGMPIIFRVAIKPTPTIAKVQDTVDMETGKNCKIEIKGRHDPCIGVRAVPVVEGMAAICMLDLIMGCENGKY